MTDPWELFQCCVFRDSGLGYAASAAAALSERYRESADIIRLAEFQESIMYHLLVV